MSPTAHVRQTSSAMSVTLDTLIEEFWPLPQMTSFVGFAPDASLMLAHWTLGALLKNMPLTGVFLTVPSWF